MSGNIQAVCQVKTEMLPTLDGNAIDDISVFMSWHPMPKSMLADVLDMTGDI